MQPATDRATVPTKMNVLIAEDDTVSRLLLQATLRVLGHESVAVADGRRAWERIQQEHFPVLISDWLMPEMDGLELSRLVRASSRGSYTFILLLTSLGGKANYLEAMNAGADDFITKPFDEDQLAARLVVAGRMLGLQHHVTQLEGLLPICAYCKKINDGRDGWKPIERYVSARSNATFSHGICPACMAKHFNFECTKGSV